MDIRAAYHGRGMRQWVRWTAGAPSRAPVRRTEVKAPTTPAVIRDGRGGPREVITTTVNLVPGFKQMSSSRGALGTC
ncbi:hypothetical protein ACFCW6_23260 [Streptomyces sp. NPDC056333]|uniref:hypothetical protein n=1 Tax=Streptomyces sp. NPDC056333 TaxID=3345786 RepID=UPI0035D9122F